MGDVYLLLLELCPKLWTFQLKSHLWQKSDELRSMLLQQTLSLFLNYLLLHLQPLLIVSYFLKLTLLYPHNATCIQQLSIYLVKLVRGDQPDTLTPLTKDSTNCTDSQLTSVH